MTTEQFDLIVLGAGSAARDGAGKAKREHGANIAMIERERWGGSCPNIACRPTKAYLTAAELMHDINTQAENRGISVSKAEIELARTRACKDSIRRDQERWQEVLGQQYTVHPELVRLALLFACPLSGAELDLDLLEFLGELERHLRALSDRFMRSPFLRVGFDHAEQAVSFIGYPGCEIEAFINEEQSP